MTVGTCHVCYRGAHGKRVLRACVLEAASADTCLRVRVQGDPQAQPGPGGRRVPGRVLPWQFTLKREVRPIICLLVPRAGFQRARGAPELSQQNGDPSPQQCAHMAISAH